jgi:hypothetical protein
MTAVVILEAIVLALLVLLVIGLLRTHADVLRRLHEMGAGIYDNAVPVSTSAPPENPAVDLARRVAVGVAAPPLERTTGFPPATALSGVTPRGSQVSVAVTGTGRLTLLAFLSTGCTTCGDFWRSWREGGSLALDDGVVPRVVIVTKGPANEHPNAVLTLAPADFTVVMSNDAWSDYGVPASPYFVLVDGVEGVIGEGSAATFDQLTGVLQRASAEARGVADGRDNPGRVDAELRRAGIVPGDPRLYEWGAPTAPTAPMVPMGPMGPTRDDARRSA